LTDVGALCDQGIHGIVLSNATKLSELEQLQQAATYPSRGSRSVNPFVSAAAFPGDFDSLIESSLAVELWAMAETPELLEALESPRLSRVGVSGFTGLIAGPFDLAARLGVANEASSGPLLDRITRYQACAATNGLRMGIFVRDGSSLTAWLDKGVRPDMLIAGYDSDLWFSSCRTAIIESRLRAPLVS
jgi:2-keto-3-deoxy-L-rhamnonate aldolase RhmA